MRQGTYNWDGARTGGRSPGGRQGTLKVGEGRYGVGVHVIHTVLRRATAEYRSSSSAAIFHQIHAVTGHRTRKTSGRQVYKLSAAALTLAKGTRVVQHAQKVEEQSTSQDKDCQQKGQAAAGEAAPEAEEEPELVLAQSAEVTHESGVLDDAAVVEALGQTEGESLDAFSATTSAPLGAVAGAALGNARCRVLDLRNCPLNDAGDAAFREALASNNTIVAVRTAVNLDDVAATRASNGLPPLIVTDEDSEDDSEDEEEEGVYCDGAKCGKLLAGDAEVFTDGTRDFCASCKGSKRGLRRALARDRFADAVLADMSS